ncbi:hypothetical protein Bbelb_320030 [Branchiostoma belcheri]|nr:hypothetical protein Bbelb_320030 [Branchiostoma belcheri]
MYEEAEPVRTPQAGSDRKQPSHDPPGRLGNTNGHVHRGKQACHEYKGGQETSSNVYEEAVVVKLENISGDVPYGTDTSTDTDTTQHVGARVYCMVAALAVVVALAITGPILVMFIKGGDNHEEDISHIPTTMGAFDLEHKQNQTAAMEQRLTEKTAAKCPLLSPLLHGSVNSYGDVVHFTCEQGYRLVGKSSLTCLSDRTWNGNSPTCTAAQCPLLSPPLHGSESGSNSYGDVVHFTCEQGYRLVGNSSLTCLSDGTWSGRSATCAATQKWRNDGQCGAGYTTADGSTAECDPDSIYPCCSEYNWCGYTAEHCDSLTPLRQILTAGSQLQRLGCWGDTADRAVPTLEGTDPVLDGPYPSRTDPVRKCQDAAAKRGYTVFAVQDGGWCAASADALQAYVKYGESDACRPDGEGGPWANEVYRIVAQPPSWSASSEFDSRHSAHLADINTRETADAAGAWAAATNNEVQWLMRDLGKVSVITGVITKGRNYSPDWPYDRRDQYVTSYVITYGDGNGEWKFYINAAWQVTVFPGNYDSNTEVINDLRDYNGPITARFIRIHPRTWHGHISMRAKIVTEGRGTRTHTETSSTTYRGNRERVNDILTLVLLCATYVARHIQYHLYNTLYSCVDDGT